MSDHVANSSDLSYARALSVRLADSDEGAESQAPVSNQPGFTSLSSSTPAAAEAPPVGPTPDPTTMASWDELLEWTTTQQAGAEVFVVDPEGFVIAHCGHLEHEELEGLGPQFQELASMASRIEAGTARVVSLKLDRGWLTGIRFDRGEGRFFLVGLIAPEPISSAAEAVITAQVEHNLDHL